MKKSKKLIIIVIAILVMVLLILGVATAIAVKDKKDYKNCIQASERYVDELDYERAIAELESAIEIEPKEAEAYLALADIYMQLEDYASASETLQKAKKQVEDADDVNEILVMMDEVHQEKGEKVIDRLSKSEDAENNENIGKTEGEYVYEEDGGYCVIERDAKGNCLKKYWYYADGTLYSVDEFDDRGREDVTLWYALGAELETYWLYEYDLDGHWTKVRQYDASGNLLNVIEY